MNNFDNIILFVSSLAGSIFIGFLVQFIVKLIAKSKRLNKKDELNVGSLVNVFFLSISRAIPFLFLVIGLKVSLSFLTINTSLNLLIGDILSVLTIISIGYFVYCLVDLIDYLLTNITKKTETTIDDMVVPMVRKTLKVAIVVLILVQIAQVLSDKPITSILAGLGVGGLAVALAAQDAIKNFFGSLIIFADKPFELGEFVNISDYKGIIEEVGFRSTRIRTLSGHLVTIPNGELASQMIENISKRPYIKRTVEIGVTYDTSLDKLEEAKSILSEILSQNPHSHKDFPPRIYFKDFNSSSLDLIAIYWFYSNDYWAYMKYSDDVNTSILKRFNEAKIDFAFPTQTLYVNH